MRTATFAKLSLTAAVGLGAVLSQAGMASAGGPGPIQGGIKSAPTTSTTIKPIPADPADWCDIHLCLPADEVEPDSHSCGPIDCIPADEADPDDGGHSCGPIDCIPADPYEPQGGFDGPDDKIGPNDGCTWTHGCPQEEVPCSSEDDARTQCDEPCRSDQDARTQCDPPGETDGGTTDGGTTDGGTDGRPTDGGTDGGTTGGGGRLPKTGVEIMSLVGLGAGGIGIGAALKRFGRKPEER